VQFRHRTQFAVSRLLPSVFLAVTLGCDHPSNPGQSIKTSIDRQSTLHNYTRVSDKDVALEVWTNGSTFRPGSWIDVGLRLTTENPWPDPSVQADVVVQLTSLSDSHQLRERTYKVTLQKVKRTRFDVIFVTENGLRSGAIRERSGWEADLSDALGVDGRNPQTEALSIGHYQLAVEVRLPHRPALTVHSLPIEVWIRTH
jgi:hypothetical protein